MQPFTSKLNSRLLFSQIGDFTEYLAGNSRFRKRCEMLRAAAKR